jgi:hypothetical protein
LTEPLIEPLTEPVLEDLPLIFQHIERYLGSINASWIETLEGDRCAFQIVRCTGRVLDTTFFCTLGLSSHRFPHGSGLIRHELLIAVPKTFGTRNIPPLLQQLGTIALNRNTPLLIGEVMMGKNEVFAGWSFRGFYASHPSVIEDDAFAECIREDGQQVQFVWMAPLYQREIEFFRQHGPGHLEDLFVEKQIDLVDLNRKPAVD